MKILGAFQSIRRRLGQVAVLGALGLALGCDPTSHPVTPSPLGKPQTLADLERVIDVPGELKVTTINSADWAVDLAGLLNLEHPKAKAAGRKNHLEPISIFFHTVEHPKLGLFLVDSGIERRLGTSPGDSAISSLVRSQMHLERLRVHTDLASFLAQSKQPVQGLFLTHLHLDHIAGLPDLPNAVPIYVGQGETEHAQFMNLFVRSTINSELAGKSALREFHFPSGSDALDVFGDGQFWALTVPGHTRGSIAYVARTPEGPVLITGDAAHTAWGWKNGVEPGTFSDDQPKSAQSLALLKALSARHPQMQVRLGHQAL